MRDLIKKYHLGYEGYLFEKGLAPSADPATVAALAVELNNNIMAMGEGTETGSKPEDTEKGDQSSYCGLDSGEGLQVEQAEALKVQE